jgi:hypothetical protein
MSRNHNHEHSHSRTPKRGSHVHHSSPKKKSSDPLADAYAKLQKGQVVSAGHADHPMMGPHESIREIDYNGHHITIRTQYEIKVDGKPIAGHVYVDNDGKVSTHALPAYSFVSTVDLVKKLIDAFPSNFGKKKR